MSNIFRGTEIVYFQVPKALIVSSILHDLRLSPLKMYIALCYQAQQFSRSDLRLTNTEFADLAGIALNSVKAGRNGLLEQGLIQVEALGCGYKYQLCDPATRQPLSQRKTAAPAKSETPEIVKRPTRTRSTRWTGNFFEALTAEEKRRYFEMRLPTGRKPTTGGFMVVCPFHPDTLGSLKVETETGRWYCHGCPHGGGMVEFEMKLSGCNAKTAVQQIADVLGRRDLIRPVGKNSAEQNFNYSDENGELLYQIRRYKNKKFGAYRPDPTGSGWKKNMVGVRRVPYRLPEVVKARVVIVNEGEKHCDRCKQVFPESDIAATSSPFGAGKWRDEFAPFFSGKSVFIIADNDAAGRQHAETVARSLEPYALEVRIVEFPDLPTGGDVIDYLDEHSREELVQEFANTPVWNPKSRQ